MNLKKVNDYFQSSEWNNQDTITQLRHLYQLFHPMVFSVIPYDQRICLLTEFEKISAKIEKRKPFNIQVYSTKNENSVERYDMKTVPRNHVILIHTKFLHDGQMLFQDYDINEAGYPFPLPSQWKNVLVGLPYYLLYRLMLCQEEIKQYNMSNREELTSDLPMKKKELILNQKYFSFIPRDSFSRVFEPMYLYSHGPVENKMEELVGKEKIKTKDGSNFLTYLQNYGIHSFIARYNQVSKPTYDTLGELKQTVLDDIICTAAVYENMDVDDFCEQYDLPKVRIK